MGLALENGRLSVSSGRNAPPIQRIKPARTSIAEDAVFIPKPHKRVDFKLETPGGAAAGSAPAALGSGNTGMQTGGDNIALGTFGQYGLTAVSRQKAASGGSAPKVVMEVISNPQKDFSVISTQEEGRQSHNAKTVNFTQAYDAYGRPRMGASREPYDFAATKFVSKTSAIRFAENMKSSHAQFDQYLSHPLSDGAGSGSAKSATADSPATLGSSGGAVPADTASASVGAGGGKSAAEVAGYDPANQSLGSGGGKSAAEVAGYDPAKGMVSADPANASVGAGGGKSAAEVAGYDPSKVVMQSGGSGSGYQAMDGMTAEDVAKKMGMNTSGVMGFKETPDGFGSGGGMGKAVGAYISASATGAIGKPDISVSA